MALSLDGTTGISASGNITGGNVIASGALIVSSFQPTSVSATGNVTGGNILTGGLISATGAITGAAITGSSLTVTTGNITGGNLILSGAITDSGQLDIQTSAANANIVFTPNGTGNVNLGRLSASGNITGSYILGNGSQLTGVDATQIVNGTSNARVVSSGGNIAVGIGGTSNVFVVATTGIYTTGLSSVSGNVTAANVIINGSAAAGSGVLIVSGNIQTSTSNATSNIGNASNYFNRLFAQATTALYADLAEVYKADAQYPPGTVLVFGGTQEVTMSTVSHDNKIAGVVSTHPAHVMNSGLQSEFTVEVGLIGRVPCRVIGPISAGDRVVSSNRAGVAERLDMSQYQPGVIIGKALESYSGTDVGVIEVVVGRL